MKYKVLNLDDKPDNNGDSFEGCRVEFDSNRVPLLLYFRKEIEFYLGEAELFVEKDAVYAKLEFFKKDPEQQLVYQELTPCIGALAIERDEEDPSRLKKIEIKSVSLDVMNTDPRIHSLKGQKNGQKNS